MLSLDHTQISDFIGRLFTFLCYYYSNRRTNREYRKEIPHFLRKISTRSSSRSPLQPVWTACFWRDRLTITVIKLRSLLLRVLENCSWLTVCRVKLKKVKLFLFVNQIILVCQSSMYDKLT